jgi:class 3 adenylate cyclase
MSDSSGDDAKNLKRLVDVLIGSTTHSARAAADSYILPSSASTPSSLDWTSGVVGNVVFDPNLVFQGKHGLSSPIVTVHSEVADLQRKLQQEAQALRTERKTAAERQKEVETLRKTIEDLNEKQQLAFLLERVRPEAHKALLESVEFRNKFLGGGESDVFVMSVDIRRSTELMLKARQPQQFASFITGLCNDLMAIVRDNFGVVDKFTGDGILAFFPTFFSGEDCGHWATRAAAMCHQAFSKRYSESRGYFSTVLVDVGLGIGIDFGQAQLVQVAGGLTVVGAPVVYACRLSGGPANTTLLNQPAFEQINSRYSSAFFLEESEIEIKNEGRILAYAVRPNGRGSVPALPGWTTSTPSPQKK